jgi:hypothetical protein
MLIIKSVDLQIYLLKLKNQMNGVDKAANLLNV